MGWHGRFALHAGSKCSVTGEYFRYAIHDKHKHCFSWRLHCRLSYVFWELWRFVKPALTEKELRSTRGSIFFVSAFFFMGAAFGYFLLAPFTYSFLANYQLGKTGIMRTIP